ncbi:hypothetical protein D3C81_1727860 [compost metagenome]
MAIGLFYLYGQFPSIAGGVEIVNLERPRRYRRGIERVTILSNDHSGVGIGYATNYGGVTT